MIIRKPRKWNQQQEKIQRGIFEGDFLALLLLIVAMVLLSYILRKCTGGYKFTSSKDKINRLKCTDGIKLFEKKNERDLEILIQAIRINGQEIGMEFLHRKMCHAYNEKQEKTNYGKKRTAEPG